MAAHQNTRFVRHLAFPRKPYKNGFLKRPARSFQNYWRIIMASSRTEVRRSRWRVFRFVRVALVRALPRLAGANYQPGESKTALRSRDENFGVAASCLKPLWVPFGIVLSSERFVTASVSGNIQSRLPCPHTVDPTEHEILWVLQIHH